MSKASHSDELVTRINHADIHCEIFVSDLRIPGLEVSYTPEESLHAFIKGIGDYLTRVVGSVPIDLRITLRVYNKTGSVYPSPAKTFGPMYYGGQGQAIVEYSELLSR